MRDLEFDLWDAVVNGPRPYGVIELDQATIDELVRFATAASGWWHWDEESADPGRGETLYLQGASIPLGAT